MKLTGDPIIDPLLRDVWAAVMKHQPKNTGAIVDCLFIVCAGIVRTSDNPAMAADMMKKRLAEMLAGCV